MVHERHGDSIAEAAGEHGAATESEILDLFEISAVNQEARVAFGRPHAAPDFRNQHAHVVIHAKMRADVSGGGGEAVVPCENRRDERVVEINDGPERVEWTLGKRALAAESRGRRRFAREARDALHEKLGQLLIVNRSVHRERGQTSGDVRRTVFAAGQNGSDRKVYRPRCGDIALETRGDPREIGSARSDEVRALLEIARI